MAGRAVPFTKVPTGDPKLDMLQDRLAESFRNLAQPLQFILVDSGAPAPSLGSSGNFYFRTDAPGVSGQRLYVKSGAAWVGLL